ncbi:hypothetical protein PC118_g4224 [Phytophthora cactorum]|uniref:Uncharacterized protein n=1 Tax=Phytophthora cactorum TaxID=29920 RepID=A0A8T1GL62_9STRA|nr:hypothetical protein PC118_g4224 [Phytophthora cactorum]
MEGVEDEVPRKPLNSGALVTLVAVGHSSDGLQSQLRMISDSDENGNDEDDEEEVLTEEPIKYYVDYNYDFLGE